MYICVLLSALQGGTVTREPTYSAVSHPATYECSLMPSHFHVTLHYQGELFWSVCATPVIMLENKALREWAQAEARSIFDQATSS